MQEYLTVYVLTRTYLHFLTLYIILFSLYTGNHPCSQKVSDWIALLIIKPAFPSLSKNLPSTVYSIQSQSSRHQHGCLFLQK